MPSVTIICGFCPYGVPTNTMPRWTNGTSAVRIVVSWPPWMVPVLVKIPVALSSSSPLSQRPPVVSINCFICALMLP